MSLRIIFMGTPEFAVASLDTLVKNGYDIAGVVTAPDKPAGRGMNLQQSAVKKYAIEHQLNVLQPEKLRDAEFISQLKLLNADLHIVVAFRMLPELVWNMPPMGTINVHGSLLPKYRGAAPINWAIINGEKETGVTTFKLKHEIDTGNILLQEKIVIRENETAGELHDEMKETGAHLLIKTVKGLENNTVTEIPQDSNYLTPSAIHAPKIFKDTCKINWNCTVDEVYNLIRGLSPYPGAFTHLENKIFKIFLAKKENAIPNIKAGNFITDHKNFLKFACVDGFISVDELQLAGKKRMNVSDFLRGHRFDFTLGTSPKERRR
jgi:methionyl-tRNA formyltransferase